MRCADAGGQVFEEVDPRARLLAVEGVDGDERLVLDEARPAQVRRVRHAHDQPVRARAVHAGDDNIINFYATYLCFSGIPRGSPIQKMPYCALARTLAVSL